MFSTDKNSRVGKLFKFVLCIKDIYTILYTNFKMPVNSWKIVKIIQIILFIEIDLHNIYL